MTIGFWGDSITYGSCDSEGLGWVGRLRRSVSVEDYRQFYNFVLYIVGSYRLGSRALESILGT
jgi:lysophospholipase L1-like esterase